MTVPADLQKLYDQALDLASKDKETMAISPDLVLAIIERIADLEADAMNLSSYIHYECRKKIEKAQQIKV